MIFRITDGTTTINLHGGPVYGGEDYVPRTPEVSEQEFAAESLMDGGELIEATRRNVAESVPIAITGTSVADIQAKINNIERLLEQATERQRRGVGARVYVEYRPGATGDVYRSEILRGVVELREASDRWLDAGAVGCVVAWKRRFYWEGPEAELALENAHGTGTGGVTVYNHYDSQHENFVDIDGDDVAGAIPAACRIQIANTYNVADRLHTVIIGQNVFSHPASLDHVLEGEDAAYNAGSASALPASPNASLYSDGQYQPVTWAGDSLALAQRWALTTTLLGACAGGWFRLWARFISFTDGLRITPQITYPSGTPLTVVAEAPEVTLGEDELQDLGVLQIPPWLRGETTLSAVDLTLYGRCTGGATYNLDYILLDPLDGYRMLYPRGYGTAYGETIIDDGIEATLYKLTASYKAGIYLARGDAIKLWPGQDQRLVLLSNDVGADAEVLRTASVRIYYRPRRLTL